MSRLIRRFCGIHYAERSRMGPLEVPEIPNEPMAFDEIDITDNTGEIGMKFSDFMQIYTSPQAAERKSKKSKPSATDDAAGKSAESKNAKK